MVSVLLFRNKKLLITAKKGGTRTPLHCTDRYTVLVLYIQYKRT